MNFSLLRSRDGSSSAGSTTRSSSGGQQLTKQSLENEPFVLWTFPTRPYLNNRHDPHPQGSRHQDCEDVQVRSHQAGPDQVQGRQASDVAPPRFNIFVTSKIYFSKSTLHHMMSHIFLSFRLASVLNPGWPCPSCRDTPLRKRGRETRYRET